MNLSIKIKTFILPIVIAVASCINDDDAGNGTIVSIGSKLPDFEVQLNDGSTFRPSDFNGTPLVIIFFNTSCEDCRAELPVIQQVYAEMSDIAAFVAIAREESENSIEEFWEANDLTIPFAAQADRHIYNQFASSGIPRIYIADATHSVSASFGPDDAPTADILHHTISILVQPNKATQYAR